MSAFKNYKVVEKARQSAVIVSVRLAPEGGGAVPPALPGQFLTLRVPTAGRPVLRNYSVSGDCDDHSGYRISVKEERRPSADLPDGHGTAYVHDTLELGATVRLLEPRGHFVLDEASSRPVVLLSGGVGQTPLLAMLHRLAPTGRSVHYLHACENGAVHAHRDEVVALAERAHGEVRVHFAYRVPSADDVAGGAHHSVGLLDRDRLATLLPGDDCDVYLYGPGPFMDAMWTGLTSLGVPEQRIAHEFFGPARPLGAKTSPEPIR